MSETAEATPINPRAELDALRIRVVQQCTEEINAVLKKHGCALNPVAQYVPDGHGTYKLTIQVNVAPTQ